MQGDDLVAEDVVAGPEVPGDSGGGGEVGPDQGVGDPGLGTGVDDGGLRDLAPAERARGEGRAVTC